MRDPQGKFDAQALLCTNQAIAPQQILEWFVRRWQIEVTFQEVRAHLGVETQRQWSDLAIVRTTPALLGLFSLVTLLAHHLQGQQQFSIRQAAWYTKPLPTFVDAVALLRQYLWQEYFFHVTLTNRDGKNPSNSAGTFDRYLGLRRLNG